MSRPVKPADFALYRMLSAPSFSPNGRKVAFSVKRANIKDDSYESNVYVCDVAGKGSTRFTRGGKDFEPSWSPDGKSILFLSRRNFDKEEKGGAIYVIGSAGGEARLLHKGKEAPENPKWSPDSGSIYFLSFVADSEQDDVKVITRPGFWFNGLGFIFNKRKHLFVLDVATGKVKQLTSGEFDVADFEVSHDGARVAYLAVTKDLEPFIADVYVLDLSSGAPLKLTDSKMQIDTLTWSPDDTRIAFLGNTMTSGLSSHNHIWVINPGSPAVQIEFADRNKGNTLNTDARSGAHAANKIVWTAKGIYFVQQDGASARLHLWKEGGGDEVVIGGGLSIEGYDVAGGRVVYVKMDENHLQELYVQDVPLTSFNEPALKELDVVAPEPFSFTASDGEPIEGWVMLPTKGEKVPAILYVHGGPKTTFGHSYMHEFQTFVSAGYAVVFMNPRGSDGYSEKFSDIRGKYGTRDMDDLFEGLDRAVEKFPRIDGKRVAIAGGSYGGFMANWVVGHTDRFKAAVADRSICNWVSMWGTSDIGPYFTKDQIGGDPWSGEERLLHDSPLRYAQEVKTPIMLVHSTEDYRCWMVEGITFYTALKQLGKEAVLVLIPGESHDLSRSGKPKHRVARLEQYLRWFDSHLKEGEKG